MDTESGPAISNSYIESINEHCFGYRLALNKRALSPILLAILAILSMVPAIPRGAALVVTPPSITMSPTLITQDVGGSFDLVVYVSDIMDLIAYDVEINYDTNALTATSAEFTGCHDLDGDLFPETCTVFSSFSPMSQINVVSNVTDGTGSVRSVRALLGGLSKDVFIPEALIIIHFTVDNVADSLLTVSDASVLVTLVGMTPTPCYLGCYTETEGSFQAPPAVALHRWDASVAPSDRQQFLSSGDTKVTLVGTVKMHQLAARGGYAFVVFDILFPGGGGDSIASNIVFVEPGQIVDVTAEYTFPGVQGRYELFATIWRGPSADLFVPGEYTSGLHFFVHF